MTPNSTSDTTPSRFWAESFTWTMDRDWFAKLGHSPGYWTMTVRKLTPTQNKGHAAPGGFRWLVQHHPSGQVKAGLSKTADIAMTRAQTVFASMARDLRVS